MSELLSEKRRALEDMNGALAEPELYFPEDYAEAEAQRETLRAEIAALAAAEVDEGVSDAQ